MGNQKARRSLAASRATCRPDRSQAIHHSAPEPTPKPSRAPSLRASRRRPRQSQTPRPRSHRPLRAKTPAQATFIKKLCEEALRPCAFAQNAPWTKAEGCDKARFTSSLRRVHTPAPRRAAKLPLLVPLCPCALISCALVLLCPCALVLLSLTLLFALCSCDLICLVLLRFLGFHLTSNPLFCIIPT
jgi:hypothetical protein